MTIYLPKNERCTNSPSSSFDSEELAPVGSIPEKFQCFPSHGGLRLKLIPDVVVVINRLYIFIFLPVDAAGDSSNI